MEPFILILGIILIVLSVLVPVLIVRWIFRINTQIALLESIRDQLIKLNKKQNVHKSAKSPMKALPPKGLFTPHQ